MSAYLQCNNLNVGWHRNACVVDAIELEVPQGQRLAIIGINGSGKTTLLRTLGGLLPPLQGTITWDGQNLPNGPLRAKQCGFVFQTETPCRLTVKQVVTLGLGLEHPPSQLHTQRVMTSLQRNKLDHLANKYYCELSGGESQRVKWARATVAEPKVLLLDEPTNHLDPTGVITLYQQLDALADDTTVVLTTHNLELASRCDRVLLLHAGRCHIVGSPSQVLTAEHLNHTWGIALTQISDPQGGQPFYRILPPAQNQGALV